MKTHSIRKYVALAALSLIGSQVQAAEYQVDIQNLTRGTYLTPLLVSAHSSGATLFTPGTAASDSLQMMAEGGNISGLVADLAAVSATTVENPAAGLLAPGQSTTAMLDTGSAASNMYLSIAAMMLPTNDGFVAINSMMLPTEGSVTWTGYAYDAGTEANDEMRGSGAPGEAGFPVPPPMEDMIGMNGTGMSASVEGFVHIHRGVIGDMDMIGGVSDINAGLHRWLNPVIKVTVTMK